MSLLLIIFTAGCAGTATEPAPEPAGVGGLDAAVAAVGASRRPLLSAVPLLTAARSQLDRADAAAQTGSGKQARAAREGVTEARTVAAQAQSALTGQAADYRQALTRLLTTAQALPPAQRASLQGVGAGGEAEAAAIEAVARTIATSSDTYTALDRAQATWVQRVGAGWYRSTAEAADAYTVLVQPQRKDLEQARSALAGADAARERASMQQQATLRAADAALEPLRESG